MDRPPLDEAQMAKALDAYYRAREQAWRYVLGATDPGAADAPALPLLDVLRRVQAQLTQEMTRYTEAVEEVPAEEQTTSQEEPPHDTQS